VAEDLAEKLRTGEAVRKPFGDAVFALLQELLDHNRSEETLLEPLLRAGDTYSPQRISRMFEEHAGEHELMRQALHGSDLGGVAQSMPEFGETLRAHMDAEERTFLHARVLRDD